MQQAHADAPPVVIDALDDVSVELELGDDGGREVNPAGVKLGKSNRLVAGLAQSLQQPLLLDVSERHRRIALERNCGRLERFQVALLPPDGWRLRVRCGELEHESDARLATSANSTRSTSVANRLGLSTRRARGLTPRPPRPAEQAYPAQRPRNNDLEFPRHARQRHSP